MPKAGRTALKATWGKATGLEEHPVAAGQAREIPAGKQKAKLELEPCRKFGGCLVSQHLVNTSCGWRLTSSSTTPPFFPHPPPGVCPGAPICHRGTGGTTARRKPSTRQLFIWVGFWFFFPCAIKTEHLFLCSLKFQDTFPAIQTPSWHSKQQYILYNWFFFFVVFTTL